MDFLDDSADDKNLDVTGKSKLKEDRIKKLREAKKAKKSGLSSRNDSLNFLDDSGNDVTAE